VQTRQATPSPGPAEPGATPLYLRMTAVMRMTGLGRSTIYRLIAERKFPRQVQLSQRAVGWRPADLDAWSRAREEVRH
jgi:prophage regulatory protein